MEQDGELSGLVLDTSNLVGIGMDDLLRGQIFLHERPGVWAVIDSGATRSIGGNEAIEKCVEELEAQGKIDPLTVEPMNTPGFVFGNGARDSAVSSAVVQVPFGQGEMDLRLAAGEHRCADSRLPWTDH